MSDLIEAMARKLYAASCAWDPVEVREPDWGRGGFKTEVLYWNALATAALAALRETHHLIPKDQEPVRWQPIETAPRDGTWVILYGKLNEEPHGHIAFWGAGGDWFDSEAASNSLTGFGWKPTHWLPLYAPEKPNGL